ncbi:hypothetical protein D9619_013131 [Psilocybe cf. subviscida]|uniref:P-loop containing nucleoside triphosphate hydrolase protein n=1 Tax=Psilocybe cf. subviscida TaxID=2480587 RepID=A0A8H5B6H0_9AGAR|nr:hypothetical protein D9619_013131 [Psilocybe cf. subviscida]
MNLNYSGGSQYVLSWPTFAGIVEPQRFQFNSLLIPISVAVFLFLLQVTQSSIEWLKFLRSNGLREREESAAPRDLPKDSGGLVILAFSFARLFICLALLVLSIITLQRHPRWVGKEDNWTGELQNPGTWMAITYLYASILAAVSLTRSKPAVRATRYNNLLLLTTLGVFVYRDIWPLATYDEGPQDVAEGSFLWAKIALLILSALIIPLFIPRRYVPVDPKDPMPVPNAEQTCSIFSRFIFSYMSPVIWAGYRTEHLEVEDMPPLMDTDYSKNLVKYSFPHIDPYKGAKRRHIFFGLMYIFSFEFLLMATALVAISVANYLSPLAIYRILRYLELGPDHNGLRPWFWIAVLFISCAGRTVGYTNYHFYATRVLVHAEAILTQLIYEHSLRIRLASENLDDNGSSEESSADGNSSNPKPTTADSHGTESNNIIGKINSLITVDLGNITQSRDFLFLFLAVPLQIILCIIFLYRVLGWSAIVGIGSLIILLPVPGYATKLLHDVQKRKMQLTDARVQKVSEAVGVLKMIKLFGWENKMSEQIQNARDAELAAVFKMKILSSLTVLFNSMIPTISMLVTYITYAAFLKQQLDPAIIFSTLTAFRTLSQQLYEISDNLTQTTQGKVSLDRVDDFLKSSELLDAFDTVTQAQNTAGTLDSPLRDDVIGFRNASFSWSLASASNNRPRRKFRLKVEGVLTFKPGCINLIVGPTGCGKTSMLMALLGEMHYMPIESDSWFNLPRDGGVAYAAQESWVQNDTIRNNILFGQACDDIRYQKVLKQTALDKDLELFDAGDNTEVGEKGITLSGGQKARVTLARAIYSQAKILLLDDILASLDVHTASWIVEACLKGDLVRGRTVILVTHNVALVSPIVQFVVSIGAGGAINAQETDIDRALMTDEVLAAEMELDKRVMENADKDAVHAPKESSPTAGKLILAEEVPKGRLSRRSMSMFFSSLGGRYPVLFFALWIAGFFISECFKAFQKWFLGFWGAQYESHDPSEVSVSYYVLVYSSIILGSIVLTNLSYCFYLYGTIRASRKINAALVASVLTSTVRWIDETPTSRIVTRFTQDLNAVDNALSQRLYVVTAYAVIMLTSLTVVVIFSPIFILPGLLVVSVGVMVGRIYLSSQLSAKREQSNAKSPVLAHFNAAIAGIVSIRAYAAQNSFKEEASKRIDKYSRISRTTYNLARWVATRIDFLGDLYNAALACYLVYWSSISSSNAGFSLNMATDLCSYILWSVLFFNDFIVQSNSLERIQGYIDIEHEPEATESGKPPAAWPTSGDLVVEGLSARYSRDGPSVLQGISFHIKSGERVGIVGRTGSGKSSLTLALLRGIITEGNIYFDSIPTSAINLDALRSNITIIPQMPELLSDTLRRNLDPFDQHDDAALNEALQSAGLFHVQDQLGEARITLDSNVTAGGGNLSVGEKQIVALARAMLRRSKLLILDEATSAIDYQTDNVIQTTLRHKLNSDVTVITVAHRLQTIMDADKIIVLDAGRLAEFDSPSVLLEKEDSLFKALVDGSADKAKLYEMVQEAAVYNAQ